MTWRKCASLLTFAAFAGLTTGCVEHLSVIERGSTPGAMIRPEFWPPPGPTSIWVSEAAGAVAGTLGDEAARVARTFRSAGYEEERWYPIGVEYAHGFAVTTRLERTEEDGRPKPTRERWSQLYPQAATLVWLEGAAEVRLPGAGHYRVFFVAFTDLPFREVAHRASRWTEQTLMAAPNLPAMRFPRARAVGAGYRVGVYVYEYASESGDGEGAFVASEGVPAARQLQRAGLEGLGELGE